MGSHQPWPALEKDDASLKEELEQLLTSRTVEDPYSDDGRFAANIAREDSEQWQRPAGWI